MAQIFTESLGGVGSPTEFTEFTEQTGRECLPQIAQIFTDPLGAWEVSHRIHGIHRIDWQRRSPTESTEFTELQTHTICENL
jgi:hypothetical protein